MRGPSGQTTSLRAALAASVALLAAGTLAPASAGADTQVSSNWSGYVATGKGRLGGFAAVSGTWTVPEVTCSAGRAGYSAVWVGLGGYHRNAQRLERFLRKVPGDIVHLVGFSLGGLVVRALFRYYPAQRPGRILLLGSPQHGSRAAMALAASHPGQHLLGRSLADLNAGRPQAWTWPERETGVIAGTLAFGLGRLVASLSPPHDGTVSVDETAMPDARDRLALPVTHFGLLLSNAVARQAAGFLRTGHFTH